MTSSANNAIFCSPTAMAIPLILSFRLVHWLYEDSKQKRAHWTALAAAALHLKRTRETTINPYSSRWFTILSLYRLNKCLMELKRAKPYTRKTVKLNQRLFPHPLLQLPSVYHLNDDLQYMQCVPNVVLCLPFTYKNLLFFRPDV